MMVASSAPPSLYGLNGQVHWPTFLARTAIRSLILWPVVTFVGGVGGVRGALTAAIGGATYTGVELAWDMTSAMAAQAQDQAQTQATSFFNGFGDGLSDGLSSGPRVIDTFSP